MSAIHKTTPPTNKAPHVTPAQDIQDELMQKSAEASGVLTKAQAITQSAKELLNTAKKTVALATAREKDPSAWLNSARDVNDSFRNLLKTIKGSEKTIDEIANKKDLH